MTAVLSAFRSVRVVGAVLPAEALVRAVDLRLPGQGADDYALAPGLTVNGAVARAWEVCVSAHRAWQAALDQLPDGEPATGITRARWLLPLLYELGYGRPQTLTAGIELPAGPGETTPTRYRISHRLAWPDDTAEPEVGLALHLVGAGVPLDTRSPGVPRAPQSLLQDFLNRAPHYLWGIVANGHVLRVLRDASSLARQSYVEFDLDDMFGNQRYADFRLLFLTVHASRFAPVPGDPPSDDEAAPPLSPQTCLIERWRTTAIADGARALTALRLGVRRALEHLGTGFVADPANTALREALATAPKADADLHRALLHIAYRLIVLFVVEDRERLHAPTADPDARQRYADYFSTARLRRLAATRAGSRHTDLWDAHLIVTDALAGDGLPVLGLPGLASSLFHRDALGVLTGARLPNRSLLAAVQELAELVDPATGVTRPVDYRNLDSEELGGVYEGLLAYVPRYDAGARTFTLEEAPGNDRKKSGSYYTPSELIALVLDEALDPLIAEAVRAPDPEAALLALTVVDPAVGSGHFVVAAARRIAAALAGVRTGDTEPAPRDLQLATADVVARCVYGVDVNDLAIEIAKVALWLEAFHPGRPLPFLDAHFKVGNALLGTTPALLAEGVPGAAFAVLTGDDPDWTTRLKARNKTERARGNGQYALGGHALAFGTTGLTRRARALDDPAVASLDEARERADAWRRFDTDPDLTARRLVADAWCAAFVQHKIRASGPGITSDTMHQLAEHPDDVSPVVVEQVHDLAREYRFFHWHLEFPTIFEVPDSGTNGIDDATGWRGGFSCVVGNPPWERVKIQDKEYFAEKGRNDIVEAKTAAIRKVMIDELADEGGDLDLYDDYRATLRRSEAVTHLLRAGGRFPLTGQGDVNTYSVFAETFRMLLAPVGAAGIITPTGLATDKTTAQFFANTLDAGRLLAFYDFENEAKIFAGVHNQFRFAVTAMSGFDRVASRTRFAFYTRHLTDVLERRFELAPDEVRLLNPNTGTVPVFRSRADADLTLDVYRRFPVLVRDNSLVGNLWKVSFGTLLHMSGDSGRFHGPDDLVHAHFNGWSYDGPGAEYLPLYEAKMLAHFDHRFSTYRHATQAQLNKGTLPRLTDAQHDVPGLEPLARHWVARKEVAAALAARWDRDWLLGWRDIARASDVRTFVPSVLPTTAVGDKFLLAFPEKPANGPLLHAVWSSLAFDYVSRQKISGTGMKYFLVKQLACPTPDTFDDPTPWQPDVTLRQWVLPYVRELSYTSWRLRPYAIETGDDGPPFRWDPQRRALLRADLDAAFLHVYGLTRAEAEHVLDSFFVLRKYELRDQREFRTRRLVLDAYDRMAAAMTSHAAWTPLATTPAGAGARHPDDPALTPDPASTAPRTPRS